MPGLTLSQLLLRLVALLVISGLCGFFVALAARLLGDRGPQYDGKLTLNPFEHLDLLAIVPFVLFQTGWIKPMAIDPKALRPNPILGTVVVAAGTLGLLLLVAALIWWNRSFVQTLATDAGSVSLFEATMRTVLDMALWFAVLNLVPVPPLVAGVVLAAAAPSAAALAMRYSLPVTIGLIAILATGWPQTVARPIFVTLLSVVGARP